MTPRCSALGAPRFDEIDITLPNGRNLAIRAHGTEQRKIFKTAILNGKGVQPFVKLADLRTGGTFTFL